MNDEAGDFERALEEGQHYVLVLYVAGATRRSLSAIENARALCEEELKGRYELKIVDIYKEPAAAQTEQIVAVPSLLKKLPMPLRQVIGDLSEREKVLVGLDIKPRKRSQDAHG